MSRIIIVSLLHVVLAQNIPNAGPYINTNLKTGRQFYYRDPDSRNLEVRGQDTRRTENFNNHRQNENVYQYELANQQSLNNERTAINNNEYTLSESPEGVNNFGRRDRRVVVNPKKGQYITIDEQDPRNINLDSRSHIDGVNPDMTTEYRRKDHSHKSTQVRTNINNNENNAVSGPSDGHIELTTVPVLHLMSPTLKTNTNFHRFADNDTANDNAEVRQNNDGLIFSEIDNRNTDSFDKMTTDNEVRVTKNEAGGQLEGDKWIWDGETIASTTSTEKVMTDGDLDDRTSFSGDGCPTGEAKVRGICTPTHN